MQTVRHAKFIFNKIRECVKLKHFSFFGLLSNEWIEGELVFNIKNVMIVTGDKGRKSVKDTEHLKEKQTLYVCRACV